MSREVELATYDRGSMHYDKKALLVPENLLKRRLDFLRAEYDRKHAPTGKSASSSETKTLLMEDFGSLALRRLIDTFGDAVLATHADQGDATAIVEASRNVEALRFLRDDSELGFDMLVDVTAVDYAGHPDRDGPRFEVVYHLLSSAHLHRLRVKAGVPEMPCQIDSVVDVWPARELDGARGLRSLRRALPQSSGSAPHPPLRRVRGASASQGLSEGAAPAARRAEELSSPWRTPAPATTISTRISTPTTRSSTWGRRIRRRTAPSSS